MAKGSSPAVAWLDGDTIQVQARDGTWLSVRYIGVDAPELAQPGRGVDCWAPESTLRNRELLLGETVSLERDVSDVDRYGRALRYVWRGDDLVQDILAREGSVRAY